MNKRALILGLLATAAVVPVRAEDFDSHGFPQLDHVFLIIMENHGYSQILNNPNAPFINQLAKSANLATNYFAVGHPSLTNYLEVVGGSNFGVETDNSPDWHSMSCVTNLVSKTAATDTPPSPAICPIWGSGTDAATPALDFTNETQGPPPEINIDGVQSYAAAHTVGQTIADQLVAFGKSWKSYQESLPLGGPNLVNLSDGFFTNLTEFSKVQPQLNPPLTSSEIVALYAVKHNPFVYFRSVQEGHDPRNSMNNVTGFDGASGHYANGRTLGAFSVELPGPRDTVRGATGSIRLFDQRGREIWRTPRIGIVPATE